MIVKFKIFEKLGIDKMVYDITEKVWKNFLKVYDEKKVFSDNIDIFDTDISDLGYKFSTDRYYNFDVKIVYNQAFGRSGWPLMIGAIDRENNNIPKPLYKLKSDLIHEIQHNISVLRKYGKIYDKEFFKEKQKEEFLNRRKASQVVPDFIFPAFRDKTGNLYGKVTSMQNYLLYNKSTETFKKLISYIYLAEEDEMSSRVHEFFIDVKNTKNFNKSLTDSVFFKIAKDMANFKMEIKDFSKSELSELQSFFKLKNMKKVQKYINMKGEKIIKKIHKLSYFSNSDDDI
jgi:hypothetical protein